MKFLAFDTSTPYFSLGISKEGKTLFAERILLERKHSADLLPVLEKVLKRLKLPIREIDCFIIGLGPGSFTGLRVGISMVKVMAVSLQKPVVGVPTLDCLAEAVSDEETRIVPFIDAKRSQVYAALYERENGFLQKKINEQVTPPETFLGSLEGRTLFLGDGAFLYRSLIEKRLGKEARFAPPEQGIPDPATLLRLGGERFVRKAFENPRTLIPLYLYPKDCMIKI